MHTVVVIAVATALSLAVAAATNDQVVISPKAQGWKNEAALSNRSVRLQFEDTDIRTVLLYLADLTGETIMYGKDVQGTVTCIAPRPMCRDEALQVIYSLLETQGFTLIRQGNATKVVRAGTAKTHPIPLKAEQPQTAP